MNKSAVYILYIYFGWHIYSFVLCMYLEAKLLGYSLYIHLEEDAEQFSKVVI
jgi:hypothetical protein